MWWWWWDVVFANARQEKGLRAKNLKSSRLGLISGVPSEVGVGRSGGRGYNGADEVVVVVVGCCVCKHEVGEGAESQKIESEP